MKNKNLYGLDKCIEKILGRNIKRVHRQYNEEIEIFFTDGGSLKIQKVAPFCCESADIIDIDGNLDSLVGGDLIGVSCTTSDEAPDEEEYAWVTFKLTTSKGSVNVKWELMHTWCGLANVQVEFNRYYDE